MDQDLAPTTFRNSDFCDMVILKWRKLSAREALREASQLGALFF